MTNGQIDKGPNAFWPFVTPFLFGPLSDWPFVSLALCQFGHLSVWPFVSLAICQFGPLSENHLVNPIGSS